MQIGNDKASHFKKQSECLEIRQCDEASSKKQDREKHQSHKFIRRDRFPQPTSRRRWLSGPRRRV
jgi:hypothetical protein